MKSPHLHLNFLQDSERRSSSPVRLRVMLPVAAMLACVGMLVWWGLLATQLIVLHAQIVSTKADLEKKEKANKLVLAQKDQEVEESAQLEQMKMYSGGRRVYGRMLADIAEIMPIRVQLMSLVIPQQLPQDLTPPSKRGPALLGPTGTIERVSMRLTGRTTKETPVMSLMESLEGPQFSDAIQIDKDPRSSDLSPRVHSFKQDMTSGGVTDLGQRLLAFDIEYRCAERRFEAK